MSAPATDPQSGRPGRKLAALSARERQVLALIARGKSAKGIGLILKISPRTVNVHSASIVRKLGADNRLQAVAMAVACGPPGAGPLRRGALTRLEFCMKASADPEQDRRRRARSLRPIAVRALGGEDRRR